MARRASSDRDRGNGMELDILRYVAGLAAAAVHEINNPLTVIVGYVQLPGRRGGTRQGAGVLTKC